METIVALDIGTTGTKAALVDSSGKILASQYANYELNTSDGQVEQEAQDWWKASCACFNELVRCISDELKIVAIALSGQMQDLILADETDVLAPVILYSDTRAQNEAVELVNRIGEDHLLSVTGNLQDATSLLAKLLWVKRNRPELYHSSLKLMIGAHDYITWKLCGVHAADYTTASTTGLLDLGTNQWAFSLLDILDLRKDWLPTLVPAETQVGQVSSAAAKATGLPEGIPVFHGLGDAAAATLGAGAGEPGRYYIYLGTSGWLAATSGGSPADPRSGIFNLRHPDPERLIFIGPMLTAAGNFDWLTRQFGELENLRMPVGDNAYERMNHLASQAPIGSHGLIYLPYLSGERAPFRDPTARGVYFGLSSRTTRQDMYRAVLEGVAFAMRSIREVMLTGEDSLELSLVGGGARSNLWPQIFADVFHSRVQVLADPGEVGTRGVAILAGKALGWFQDFYPAGLFPVERTYEPNPESEILYDQLFSIFRGLYPALKDSFMQLASIKL